MNMDFSRVRILVQFWGLPPHCKTKRMGEKLGGNVIDAGIFELSD